LTIKFTRHTTARLNIQASSWFFVCIARQYSIFKDHSGGFSSQPRARPELRQTRG